MALGASLELGFDGFFDVPDEKLCHGLTSRCDIMISHIVPGGARYIFREGVPSKKLRDIFAHLVFPVRPIVPALRAPVVQRMAYPLAGKNFREAVGRPAVLPRTGARRDVNVTNSDFL